MTLLHARQSDDSRLSLPDTIPLVRCPTCGRICDPVYSRADRTHLSECAQEVCGA